MISRRPNHQHAGKTPKPSGRKRTSSSIRLRLEPLEARRLLAGISVSVSIDTDMSRSFDPQADTVAPNRLVYVDLNLNSQRDVGEPIAVTDAKGMAFFDDLPLGDYSINLITNNRTQPQVEPVTIGEPHLVLDDVGTDDVGAMATIHVTSDLEYVWSIGELGSARLLSGQTSVPSPVELGRLISSVATPTDRLLAFVGDPSEPRLIEFDLRSGSVTPRLLLNSSDSMQVEAVVATNSDLIVLTIESERSALNRLVPEFGGYRLADSVFVEASAIAGSPGSELVVALSMSSNGQSVIDLLDPRAGFASLASLPIADKVEALSMSADGRLAFATFARGGLLAIDVSGEQLKIASLLSEASWPITTGSSDGRIVTGSTRGPREVVTWDTRQWLPIKRLEIPVAAASSSVITSLAISRSGDDVLVLVGSALHSIPLALPAARPVRGDEPSQIRQVYLGVRDQSEITDSHDDRLFFTLASPPGHGTVEVSHDGSWLYTPEVDFSGLDSAVVLVHDGQNATELIVEWHVPPVADQPLELLIQAASLPENAPKGTLFGSVQLLGATVPANYRIVTSDPRFEVSQGLLFFVSGALDYETEPVITLEVVATHTLDGSRVSSIVNVNITDVNEQPWMLLLDSNTVSEREFGAIVGLLSVLEEDTSGDYEYFVFDSRFVVEGATLRLAPNVALDFRSQPTIQLTIAATDGLYELVDDFTIQVIEQNVAATGIVLRRRTLEELTSGAEVGAVIVESPQSDHYALGVSDARFEITEGILRLKPDKQIAYASEPQVALTISAAGNLGDQINATFVVSVSPKLSPYHNVALPADVNGDGIVSPLDVLIVINDLNANGAHPVPSGGLATGEPPANMTDVNGDGIVSPVDVLIIINYLNGSDAPDLVDSPELEPLTPEGEDVPDIFAKSSPMYFAFLLESERRQREMASIDAELEFLLDQLSRERER